MVSRDALALGLFVVGPGANASRLTEILRPHVARLLSNIGYHVVDRGGLKNAVRPSVVAMRRIAHHASFRTPRMIEHRPRTLNSDDSCDKTTSKRATPFRIVEIRDKLSRILEDAAQRLSLIALRQRSRSDLRPTFQLIKTLTKMDVPNGQRRTDKSWNANKC